MSQWIDGLKIEGARDRIREQIRKNSSEIREESARIAWANPEQSKSAILAIMARVEELNELFKELATYEKV